MPVDSITLRLLILIIVYVFDRYKSWAEEMKMNCFLSVAQGSTQPPAFLEISYGGAEEEPVALVGKGVQTVRNTSHLDILSKPYAVDHYLSSKCDPMVMSLNQVLLELL